MVYQLVARDFGIGFSTLSRWIQQDRRHPEKPAAQSDLEREIAELRKENHLLREGEGIALRRPSRSCIHHTDRGSQYCSHDYQKILRRHGFDVSMSGTGNCYDCAAVETFFKTNKAELLWQRSWPTRRSAELAIFKYVNGFYNPRRRHSALGWKSPLAFKAQAA